MNNTDFIGFKFKGKHIKDDFHVLHVSNGSRYPDGLIPNFTDKTAAIEGGDGTLYWGSYYTNKTWTLNIAFDSLTEVDLRNLRQAFAANEVGDLIFDEEPYKVYTAKVSAPIQLTYICFNNFDRPDRRYDITCDVARQSGKTYYTRSGSGTTEDPYVYTEFTGSTLATDVTYYVLTNNYERVYKGEGTINFIAYHPFARSRFKYSNEYCSEDYPNKYEWRAASGIVMDFTNSATNDAITWHLDGQRYIRNVWNPGDIATDFCLYLPISKVKGNAGQIRSKTGDTLYGSLTLSLPSTITSTAGWLRINSRTHLIEECTAPVAGDGKDSWTSTATGILYNQYITGGDFFKFRTNPINASSFTVAISIPGTWYSSSLLPKLSYDYLYY